jgi:hypothetical protein
MNWSKGIIFGMALFVLFIVGMCIYMMISPKDDFDQQYYEKGLSFDRDYNREQQVIKDHAQPVVQVNNESIDISFVEKAEGSIKFLRPSSSSSDKVYQVNNVQMSIPTMTFSKGEWLLVFEWTSSNRAYLFQQKIYIK